MKILRPIEIVMLMIFATAATARGAEVEQQDAVTVKIVSTWGGFSAFDRKLATEFMATHPNIRIEFTSLGADYDREKVRAYQAGDPYDMWLTGPFYSKWATQAGYTIDPAPLFRRDFGPDYQSLFVNDFFWWQGKMVGVPFARGSRVFYYNQDIIEAAGLPLPDEDWTWDDFVRIATGTVKYDSDGNIVQWGCTAFDPDLFRFYIGLEGQPLFSPDYRRATIDTPAGRAAMIALHELAFKHQAMGTQALWGKVTDDVAYSWNIAAFNQGKVALLLADDGGMKRRYEQAAQASFRLGVAPLPARKEKTANLEPTIFQIFKSRDPERTAAAWEFAKFWLTRENQVRLMTEAGYPPVRLDAYHDPVGQEFVRQWPILAVRHRAYKHARIESRISEYPTMALEYIGIRPYVYHMMMGKLTPEEAVEQMQTKCQAVLDDFWSKADDGVFELFPEESHK